MQTRTWETSSRQTSIARDSAWQDKSTQVRTTPDRAVRRGSRRARAAAGALALLLATAACGAEEPVDGGPTASDSLAASPSDTPASEAPAESTPAEETSAPPVDTSDWVTADNGLFTFQHPRDWTFELDEESVGYELADPQGETVAYVSKGQFQGDSDTGGELWSAEELAREPLSTNASEEQVILTSVKQRSDEGADDAEREVMVQILEPGNVETVLGDTGGQPFWFRTDDETAAVFMTDDDLLELEGVNAQTDERRIAQFLDSEEYRTILEIMRSVEVK
ncbi:hypothetical protein [Zhihengliuella sp.]|uniref:hypothetical protein n=1 Tax=Zhihengliuella sp. TaxID=1954483 RepID=UPI0028114D56|nr:hypothetical protein [Zhihengliuella sp.]